MYSSVTLTTTFPRHSPLVNLEKFTFIVFQMLSSNVQDSHFWCLDVLMTQFSLLYFFTNYVMQLVVIGSMETLEEYMDTG